MITQIKKIDNLGIFHGYRWPTGNELPEFKKWNLIYGWNGSGKTSLSRMLQAVASGGSDHFPELKYSIQAVGSGVFNETQNAPIKVRVFNSDYIENNIGKIEGGELNPIYIVGEDKKDLVKKLRNDEQQLERREADFEKIKKDLDRETKDRGKEFTNVAKLIGEAAKGLAPRNYTKREVTKAYEAGDGFTELSEETLEINKLTGRQDNLNQIGQKAVPIFSVKGEEVEIETYLEDLSKRITNVGAETAESVTIERFLENPKIGGWVEKGISLHESTDRCEFCGNTLTAERLDEILKHFSEADQNLREKIQSLKDEVECVGKLFEGFELPQEHDFFEEFRVKIRDERDQFSKSLVSFQKILEKIQKALDEKNRSRSRKIPTSCGISISELVSTISEVNKSTAEHDRKSLNFETEKEKSFAAIEGHFLASTERDLNPIDGRISQLKTKKELLENGDPAAEELSLSDLEDSIRATRGEIANTLEAANDLTDKLEIFLGRRDLVFKPDGEGYRIFRNGNAVKSLSEGEKTAISFIYFTVQLNDQNFDKSKGLVVIDDPISSLDANSLFQAFSFLKTAVQSSHQLIVLTHNFDFLKLVINWMDNIPESKNNRGYFMIKNTVKEGERTAQISELDPTLKDFSSEYLYLLSRIFNYKCDGSIDNAYPMANIVRKALEHLLDFLCPDEGKFYKKLQKLEFDEQKRTALNKFAQDFSHPTGGSIDPSLVPETRKCVDFMIELLREVAPFHFESVCKKLNYNPD